ncbi:phage tail tape measure protein [Seohaeicola sp. SP36]|uniref:phage tail tape measure protein n=1 Tax=unclassified Seohaeicola TaxID=2641111 RepID=UPI00237A0D38|nr:MULTISPECIES: phage tail tape measure protein [unclassified Seohaeicola]MDD9706183.1 phage tail tape measure protein [Seohaeicola sp. 4SK31]MDD9734642.1 phage tail tape measure protein [Seohaeicola sp. SP36]
MTDFDTAATLQEQVKALDTSFGAAATVAGAFDGELQRMRRALADTGRDMATLERGFSGGLRRAFDGVAFDGMKLSDALKTVATSMVNTTYQSALRPVTDHVGGLLSKGMGALVGGVLPFAKGGSFAQGRVMPFAAGGIVTGPTTFPMRGGMGLMGEAGPEAIMPLARGPDGKLGVRGGGGGAVNVVINIQTPDVAGFERSQSQIAAQMVRILGQGQRNR